MTARRNDGNLEQRQPVSVSVTSSRNAPAETKTSQAHATRPSSDNSGHREGKADSVSTCAASSRCTPIKKITSYHLIDVRRAHCRCHHHRWGRPLVPLREVPPLVALRGVPPLLSRGLPFRPALSPLLRSRSTPGLVGRHGLPVTHGTPKTQPDGQGETASSSTHLPAHESTPQ